MLPDTGREVTALFNQLVGMQERGSDATRPECALESAAAGRGDNIARHGPDAVRRTWADGRCWLSSYRIALTTIVGGSALFTERQPNGLILGVSGKPQPRVGAGAAGTIVLIHRQVLGLPVLRLCLKALPNG
jgi:hypothetical protein